MRSIQKKIPKNLYTKVKLLNMKINYSLSYPWIRTEITLRTILSLSIRTVFCIIATTWSNSLLLSKIFFESTVSAFMPPLSVLTMTGTTYISQNWASLSHLERKLSVFCELLCSLCPNVILLCSCHVINPNLLVSFQFQNQVCFSCNSGLS